MSNAETAPGRAEERAVVAAARAGDEPAFAALVERYRRELQVHCYRMLGSFEDAEDMMQETFLRGWKHRESFQGRSSFRAWLYRIATNTCLDELERRPRRRPDPTPQAPAAEAGGSPRSPADLPWLQPYPDRLLEGIAAGDAGPETAVVAKETIGLAFLAAIQLLPPRQRAALILRDVLDWSARETASLLEVTVAAANSALQRARATLKEQLPERGPEWAPPSDPSEQERALLQRYLDAHERADMTAMVALLREDAVMTMPPAPTYVAGREAIEAFIAPYIDPSSPDYVGHMRGVPTRANMQPALAIYLRAPGGTEYRAMALDVLSVEAGEVTAITVFAPELFAAFGLPATL
jgi:RNA polymerase sigma-70 factor, ECF subfamily